MEPSLTMVWIEFLTGRFFFVISGAFGLVTWIGLIYFMNRTLGIKLKEDVVPLLKEHPLAASLYFSARILAVSLFLGMLALAGASVSTKF